MGLTTIETFGDMGEPCEAGRFTAWMEPTDKCVGLWFRHFVGKGIPCCVCGNGKGSVAVFRTRTGMVGETATKKQVAA